jgi:hypothetical protein
MVGGALNASSFSDDINTYKYSEGGIDYNAGLVGALGYIVSKLAPVDTAKFSMATIRKNSQRRQNHFRITNTNARTTYFSFNGRVMHTGTTTINANLRPPNGPRLVVKHEESGSVFHSDEGALPRVLLPKWRRP